MVYGVLFFMLEHDNQSAVAADQSRDERDPDAAMEPQRETADRRVDALSKTYLNELADGIRSRFGNGPPDPEDVAQEAFSRLLEADDTAKIKNLKAYLWRTARNLVFDATKAIKIRSKYEFEIEALFFPLRGDNLSPETVVSAREQLKLINDVLRKMPEKRRRAFVLYRIEGLTMVNVAKRLRIGHSAVHKHLVKAHAELNAIFAEDRDEQ
ncbi:MAG: sigma-70 family RNA polymerase sigma factor [Pseudomonadota bacterium]